MIDLVQLVKDEPCNFFQATLVPEQESDRLGFRVSFRNGTYSIDTITSDSFEDVLAPLRQQKPSSVTFKAGRNYIYIARRDVLRLVAEGYRIVDAKFYQIPKKGLADCTEATSITVSRYKALTPELEEYQRLYRMLDMGSLERLIRSFIPLPF
jgi:hypothetical protein